MLENKVMLIRDSGLMEMLDFESSDDNLDFFYKHIDCRLIDIVRPYALQDLGKCKDLVLIVDDEGLLKDQPQMNLFASLAYGSPLCGNILLAKEQARDDGYYTVGLNEKDVQEFNDAMLYMLDHIDIIKDRF